jgi:haloacid dehalogenase superfamily, subfamily IA, variant 3 with third motif having DD or ED/haloacid dehalogenase superfamily, subfamily IA, variant 1 with third motif having Dx(3-4)D or Dx(3-4)E
MTKAIFFDLFFTLIYPIYTEINEYDVIGISASEWEKYAENDALYYERAIGKVNTEKEIIDKIVDIMPYQLKESQKQEILQRREERMKSALFSVDDKIIYTLMKVQDMGIKIGLISNADMIDSKHWAKSPLSQFFDVTIFSCNVGLLKPNVEIYRLAMGKLGITPDESIFVGDGGSDELYGAKIAGMKTVLTEYLVRKPEDIIKNIQLYTDYHIYRFDDLLKYIE